LKAESISIDIRSLSNGKRSQANSSIKVKLPKTPRFCKERAIIFNCSVSSEPSNAMQDAFSYVKCKHHSVKIKTQGKGKGWIILVYQAPHFSCGIYNGGELQDTNKQ
jgi:hypothetical protein